MIFGHRKIKNNKLYKGRYMKVARYSFFISAGLILLASIVSCGGGGGGSTTSAAPVTSICSNGASNYPSCTFSDAYEVATFAGSGVAGWADASGAAANFNGPMGLAFDASNNLYVADTSNTRIRKISPLGAVTTFAGNGQVSNIDGANPSFKWPQAVAVDSTNNVFVADTIDHRIRKLNASGSSTTFAGFTSGFLDANSVFAKFNQPWALTVDTTGNLYVADCNNHAVRKITALGVVTTLAGTGTQGYTDGIGTVAQFSCPNGLVADALGNVFVADTNNSRIRKITSAGVTSTVAGGGTSAIGFLDAVGTASAIPAPTAIALDSAGNIYTTASNRVRKIDVSTGLVTTIAGNGVSGFADSVNGSSAQFNYLQGIAVDSNGVIYVSDKNNQRIRKITKKP